MSSNSSASIPDQALFSVVNQRVHVDDLLRSLYERPSAVTAAHFKAVNAHLGDGWVAPGQMVILTPENPGACTQWEHIMMEAAAKVDEELASARP